MDATFGPGRIRRLATPDLTPAEVRSIRELLLSAFADEDGFSDTDWANSIGGLHVVLDLDGEIVAHASVVERELQAAGRPLRTGYVEAVATRPGLHGRGFGSRVMAEIGAQIGAAYELGALGTGRYSFYERLGWHRWRGPTAVRTEHGLVRTPEDDDAIMILTTPQTPELDLGAPLSCEWRPGDVW